MKGLCPMVTRGKAQGRGGNAKPRTRPYPYEFRLKMVRLFLEEGYSTSVLRERFGVSSHSVHRWVWAYREQSPEGLLAKQRLGTKPKTSPVVKKRIVKFKQSHANFPWRAYGSTRQPPTLLVRLRQKLFQKRCPR